MRFILILSALCFLTNCTALHDNSLRAAEFGKREGEASAQKWKDIFTYKPTPVLLPQPADVRYCYKAQSDVVCYDAPLVGHEYHMVGYQGPKPESYEGYYEAPAMISRQPVAVFNKNVASSPLFVGAAPTVVADPSVQNPTKPAGKIGATKSPQTLINN